MIKNKYSLDKFSGNIEFDCISRYQLHSDGIDNSHFSKISRSCKYLYYLICNKFNEMNNDSKNTTFIFT